MSNQIKKQIENLETKISFQELTIEELNQTVINLNSEIIKLKEQLILLSKKLNTQNFSNIASLSEETPPPHY